MPGNSNDAHLSCHRAQQPRWIFTRQTSVGASARHALLTFAFGVRVCDLRSLNSVPDDSVNDKRPCHRHGYTPQPASKTAQRRRYKCSSRIRAISQEGKKSDASFDACYTPVHSLFSLPPLFMPLVSELEPI
ncbi:hypothetical protein GGF46_000004 [Coemansia sp. RSA 552]|nr:hypothetical protein GGF46_005521 [Coemansia sp. RSA 552]KAJ2163222.1 hypothetical protein GGF46_000004 [Coemansia sp. RSA 552]